MLDHWLIIEHEDKQSGVMAPSLCLKKILMLLNKMENKKKKTKPFSWNQKEARGQKTQHQVEFVWLWPLGQPCRERMLLKGRQ